MANSSTMATMAYISPATQYGRKRTECKMENTKRKHIQSTYREHTKNIKRVHWKHPATNLNRENGSTWRTGPRLEPGQAVTCALHLEYSTIGHCLAPPNSGALYQKRTRLGLVCGRLCWSLVWKLEIFFSKMPPKSSNALQHLAGSASHQ